MEVLGITGIIAILIGLIAGIGIGITTAGTAEAISETSEISKNIKTVSLVGTFLVEITAIYGLLIAIIMMSNI